VQDVESANADSAAILCGKAQKDQQRSAAFRWRYFAHGARRQQVAILARSLGGEASQGKLRKCPVAP
jgi:hypothetical protein